jgi:hypothetical protein
MTDAISLEPTRSRADQAAVAAIARESTLEFDVVRALYEEEIATLSATAKVKQFVGVIATRRVKQQLRRMEAQSH